MGWYIALAFGALVIGAIVFGYFRMKNVKDTPSSDRIKHLNNKNFKTAVRQGLVLVDFWAPWCAPCKMIAPTLNEIAEEEADKITVAKVNVDQNQQLAQKYNIRNIPTLLVFQDGKVAKRITGLKPKKALLREAGLR